MKRDGGRDRRFERVLALDIRSRKCGFVVLERSGQMLDWGVRNYTLESTAAKRMSRLLDFYAPCVVILSQPKAVGHREPVCNAILREVASRSIRVLILNRFSVKRIFTCDSRTNKYDIASVLAKWYPHLNSKLPSRKRLAWSCESHSMTVFDAAAVGVAYLGREVFDSSPINEFCGRPLTGA